MRKCTFDLTLFSIVTDLQHIWEQTDTTTADNLYLIVIVVMVYVDHLTDVIVTLARYDVLYLIS